MTTLIFWVLFQLSSNVGAMEHSQVKFEFQPEECAEGDHSVSITWMVEEVSRIDQAFIGEFILIGENFNEAFNFYAPARSPFEAKLIKTRV